MSDQHCMAIDTFGRAFSWGTDTEGELGLGQPNLKFAVPQLIKDSQSQIVQFKHAKVAKSISLLLSSGGNLYYCGSLKDSS